MGIRENLGSSVRRKNKRRKLESLVGWCMPVIPAPRRLRQ
jgi:hypothetical protein